MQKSELKYKLPQFQKMNIIFKIIANYKFYNEVY